MTHQSSKKPFLVINRNGLKPTKLHKDDQCNSEHVLDGWMDVRCQVMV